MAAKKSVKSLKSVTKCKCRYMVSEKTSVNKNCEMQMATQKNFI